MKRRSRTCTGRKRLLGARCSRGTLEGVDLPIPAVRAFDPRLFLKSGAYASVPFDVEDPGCIAAGSSRPEAISTSLWPCRAVLRGDEPDATPNRDAKVPVATLSG